jgi:UDP-N-acetylglucosamine acyltransferase
MAYSHIPHDCTVGDNCIIANGVQIGGHSHIEDWVIIGGLAGLHQFARVGEHSMIGSNSKITQDVPPYIMAANNPAEYSGLNVVGLRRRGFKAEDIQTLKEAYKYLYDKSLNVSQALKLIESKFSDNIYVQKMLKFLEGTTRGVVGK